MAHQHHRFLSCHVREGFLSHGMHGAVGVVALIALLIVLTSK